MVVLRPVDFDRVGKLKSRNIVADVNRSEAERIGSEGGLPLPSAHTTVRTGPYTAVRRSH